MAGKRALTLAAAFFAALSVSSFAKGGGEVAKMFFVDAPVEVVFGTLAKSCGRNLLLSPSSKGVKVTVSIDRPVSCAQAEKLIANAASLVVRDDGTNLIVQTPKEAKESTKSTVIVYRLKTASVSEVKGTLKKTDLKGTFTFDESSNVVVFVGPEYEAEKVSSLIKSLDESAKRKVVKITAKIVEVNLDKSEEKGGSFLMKFFKGRWGGGYGFNPTTVLSGPGASSVMTIDGALALGYLNPSDALKFDLYVKALETDGKAKIISEPTVLTEENKKGVIEQGVEIPYVTTSTAASGVTTSHVQWRTATLKLAVKPRVVDGKIKLDITLKKDIPDYSVASYTNGQPAINTKSINSVVYVENGAEVVIGGIIEKDRRTLKEGVPVLKEIPLLGWLFKEEKVKVTNKKLIVTIKAEVLDGSSKPSKNEAGGPLYGRL